MPEKFSFEKDYLEKFAGTGIFDALVCLNYFIDIGVPEDYTSFQEKHASHTPPSNSSNEDAVDWGIKILGTFFQLLDQH